MNTDQTFTPEATKKPDTKLPQVFPPSIGDLKGMTGKRADKAMKKSVAVKPPLMPKALQKKNESQVLLDRIKS
jgi:hypothetical protein